MTVSGGKERARVQSHLLDACPRGARRPIRLPWSSCVCVRASSFRIYVYARVRASAAPIRNTYRRQIYHPPANQHILLLDLIEPSSGSSSLLLVRPHFSPVAMQFPRSGAEINITSHTTPQTHTHHTNTHTHAGARHSDGVNNGGSGGGSGSDGDSGDGSDGGGRIGNIHEGDGDGDDSSFYRRNTHEFHACVQYMQCL